VSPDDPKSIRPARATSPATGGNRPREEQESLGADQSAADADQTVADADQTASDSDQRLADRDQNKAAGDQRASDRDQEVADRNQDARPTDAAEDLAYEASRAEREQGTRERARNIFARSQMAAERAAQAIRRAETARLRDLNASVRDLAAEERDHAALEAAREQGNADAVLDAALRYAAEVRERAADDRARAAADRERAARDRELAAADLEQTVAELQQANLDALTGAYRRGLGDSVLQHEIDRAARSDGRLVLAFVDVDGLKEVNDRDGHAAGDALLRDVVQVIRSKLRSYDPVVRFGGDEFVCALSSSDLDDARRRFEAIRAELAGVREGASISVGLAAMRAGDTLEDLIARGDAGLYETKHDK